MPPTTDRALLLLPTASWRAQALLDAARRLGLEATVGTDRPLVWAGRIPGAVMTLDFARPEATAEALAAGAGDRPFAVVIGADDESTVLAATIARRLGLPHNPPAALEAARDKHLQRETLRRAGLPVPRFTLCRLDEAPAAIARRLAFPCVIKPRRLSASRGVMRADDVASLGAAQRRVAALLADPEVGACGEWAVTALVEEFVPGVEVALEGLVSEGRLRVVALFDKPDPLNGPFFEEGIYVTPSRLPAAEQAAVAATAEAAVRALGLERGPIHAELRVNRDGPWLIELAARPIGGLCSRALRFGGEVSLEQIVLMEALGRDTSHLAREPQSAGVMMLPIPAAGVLERVEGEEKAAAVPGIEQVVITAHPGERLVPFPEGARYPGFVFARGPRPDQVEAALREAHRHLRFVLAASPVAVGVR